jgi:hypothetical protein
MSRDRMPDFLSADLALPCAEMDAGPQPGSEDAYARIPAQSRRQAMDWSLVLASQDIHPIIRAPDELAVNRDAAVLQESWSLLVEPSQYDLALAAIHQYRLENRGWAWRKQLPGASIEIHTGAVFCCLVLIAWHWITTFVAPDWNDVAEMNSEAVRRGEWYRLFTAIFLHSDLAHLMANATFGAIFLGLAMARFGWGVTLLATGWKPARLSRLRWPISRPGRFRDDDGCAGVVVHSIIRSLAKKSKGSAVHHERCAGGLFVVCAVWLGPRFGCAGAFRRICGGFGRRGGTFNSARTKAPKKRDEYHSFPSDSNDYGGDVDVGFTVK